MRLPDQGNNLCARPRESDPANIQDILKQRKRGDNTFDQSRMSAEETLRRVSRILEIGSKQEKLRLLPVEGRHGNIHFCLDRAKAAGRIRY